MSTSQKQRHTQTKGGFHHLISYGLILLISAIVGPLIYVQVKTNSAPPTVKIGLVAPFEGLYRATGYEVLAAVKLALAERNRAGGLNGYRVELVALNDFNDAAQAAKQAKALVTDPDIMGVVGHLSAHTTLAALPVYQDAALAVSIPWSIDAHIFKNESRGLVSLAATRQEMASSLEAVSKRIGVNSLQTLTDLNQKPPTAIDQAVLLDVDAVTAGNVILALPRASQIAMLFGHVESGNHQLVQVAGSAANGFIFVSPGPAAADLSPPGGEFVEAYQALTGLKPGPRAILAYDATHILLDSIEQAIIIRDKWYNPLKRPDVSRLITGIQRQGTSGKIVFNPHGQRVNAPIWVYQISDAEYPGVLVTH